MKKIMNISTMLLVLSIVVTAVSAKPLDFGSVSLGQVEKTGNTAPKHQSIFKKDQQGNRLNIKSFNVDLGWDIVSGREQNLGEDYRVNVQYNMKLKGPLGQYKNSAFITVKSSKKFEIRKEERKIPFEEQCKVVKGKGDMVCQHIVPDSDMVEELVELNIGNSFSKKDKENLIFWKAKMCDCNVLLPQPYLQTKPLKLFVKFSNCDSIKYTLYYVEEQKK